MLTAAVTDAGSDALGVGERAELDSLVGCMEVAVARAEATRRWDPVRVLPDRLGVNAKAVTVLLGHSSIQITFDRYGHLFPGHEDEAAERLDAYMAAAVTKP
jgi:hypothetical protein